LKPKAPISLTGANWCEVVTISISSTSKRWFVKQRKGTPPNKIRMW